MRRVPCAPRPEPSSRRQIPARAGRVVRGYSARLAEDVAARRPWAWAIVALGFLLMGGGTASIGPMGLGGNPRTAHNRHDFDFDSLNDLIVSTISPESWDAVGGQAIGCQRFARAGDHHRGLRRCRGAKEK